MVWLLALAGCGAMAGPCDRSRMTEVAAMASSIDASIRPNFAAAALAEVCPGVPLTAGLDALGASPPEYRRMTEMQWLSEHPDAWLAACPAGPGVLAEALSAAPADGARLIAERCELSQLGFVAADLQGDGYPLLAVVLRKALREAGAPSVETTRLTKVLAGR